MRTGCEWKGARALGRDTKPAPLCLSPTAAQECNAEWRSLYDSPCPQDQMLPGGLQEGLGPFQRLLLLRCLVPDKLVPAVQVCRA